MDVARQHLLAGTGLADDEDGAIALGDAARQIDQAAGARRTGDRIGFGAALGLSATRRARLLAGQALNGCLVSLEHPTSPDRGHFVEGVGARAVPGSK